MRMVNTNAWGREFVWGKGKLNAWVDIFFNAFIFIFNFKC